MSIAENMSAKERKEAPVWSGFINYFPDAIIAVAQLSRIGNEQHNPGKQLHWDRSKSGDELDALARHLIDVERVDTDDVLHATKVAWRAMANLQKLIEQRAAPPVVEHLESRIDAEYYQRNEPGARYEARQSEPPEEWYDLRGSRGNR